MSNDQSLDELRAYAAQMGLLGNQPTVVDPSLDRFAQAQDPLQQYANAHLTMNAAVPGLTDTSMFGPGGAAPPAPMGGGAPAPIPSGTTTTMGPSWGPNTPPPGGSLTADSGIPDVGPITITRGPIDPHNRGFSAPGAAASHADAVTDSSPLAANAPPPAAVAGGPEPQVSGDQSPAPFFGPPGGGMYIPPRQADALNPLGKTPENRAAYEEGYAKQVGSLKDRREQIGSEADQAIQDSWARDALAQQAYEGRQAMLEGDLKAQTDHAAAMANAKQWADAAAATAVKSASSATVDQGHFFASRGAGQQIALILGAALGSLGSSLTNTPNYALQMIQGAMADDMQAQEANLKNKRASSDSALRQALDATGNLDQAKAIVRIQQLQAAKNTLDHYDRMGLGAEQRAKIAATAEGLQAQIDSQTGVLQQTHALQQIQLRPVVGGGMVGGQGNAGAAKLGENTVDVPDGKGGWKTMLVHEKDREQIVDETAKYYAAEKIYRRIKEITDNSSRAGRALDPQETRELNALKKDFTIGLKPKQGASSDADFEQAATAAGADDDAWTSNGASIMDQYLQHKKTAIDARLRAGRAYPAQGGTTLDAKGNRIPAAGITGVPGSTSDPRDFQDARKK